MEELVCPEFYVDEWKAAGSKTSADLDNAQFPVAADDGVCRLVKSEGDLLWCRCGQIFWRLEAQRVPVAR